VEHYEIDKLKASNHAKQTGLPLPVAAMDLHSQNIKNPIYWPDIDYISSDDAEYAEVNLIKHGGWFGELCHAIGEEYKFPGNTVFLHGLAVLSAAANRAFKYEYYSDQCACNLYAVTAQPPSSGKSGVNGFFCKPIAIAFDALNKENGKKRNRLMKELADMEHQNDKAGGLDDEIYEIQQKIKQLNRIDYAVSNTTAEAAESKAFKQGGMINIISAEAEAISVIMGSTYGDSSKSANYELFLKAWDNEWLSSSRVTRGDNAGYVFGSVAVIAQQDAIRGILQAGMSGRGVSERILMLSERPILGTRNLHEWKPAPRALKDLYFNLVQKCVLSGEVVLKISSAGMNEIVKFRQNIEPELADGKLYSNTMLRGAMGKADKQIIKIACLLHIAEQWKEGGRQQVKVSKETIVSAIHIFDQLSQTYIKAADDLGYAGKLTECAYIATKLQEMAQKRKSSLKLAQFRDNIKGRGALANVTGLTEKIRESYLPELQRRGYLCEHNGTIYINPKLA
jgi:hypothetical protein